MIVEIMLEAKESQACKPEMERLGSFFLCVKYVVFPPAVYSILIEFGIFETIAHSNSISVGVSLGGKLRSSIILCHVIVRCQNLPMSLLSQRLSLNLSCQ